jgi:hypothetical protein
MSIIHDSQLSDFWSDLWNGITSTATSVYRALNPFVSSTGGSQSFSEGATDIYRTINPFVDLKTGAVTVIPSHIAVFTSISQVPLIGAEMNLISDVTGVDWDTSKSPQLRVIIPIAVGIGATIITGGIAGPLFSGIVATETGAVIAGTIATMAGAYASYVAKAEMGGMEQKRFLNMLSDLINNKYLPLRSQIINMKFNLPAEYQNADLTLYAGSPYYIEFMELRTQLLDVLEKYLSVITQLYNNGASGQNANYVSAVDEAGQFWRNARDIALVKLQKLMDFMSNDIATNYVVVDGKLVAGKGKGLSGNTGSVIAIAGLIAGLAFLNN